MAVLSLSGANGQLYIYEDHLEIHREGALARMTHLKGAKCTRIDYNDIEKVKMQPGVLLISGYFCFVRKGYDGDCGLIAAARNEDCIVFRSYENATAREIKKYLNKRI